MRYPAIEPYHTGMLDVGDGSLLYWEECGAPQGKPAVVLHGGPGSGCSDELRRLFDPERYRIVLFDQRNCGRSTPHASDLNVDLSTNTTHHLLRDIELLRRQLGVARWLVFGGSWGATLALAYAEKHPERVTEMVLTGVTTTRRSEIEWLYRGVASLFPEEWHRFRAGAGATGVSPGVATGRDLVEAYHVLLEDPDPAVRMQAAREWCAWENALVAIGEKVEPEARRLEPAFQLAFARIVTHYFRHGAWLEEGQLLREAGALAGIPGIMVHGRLDVGAPLVTAWELARAWPDSELVVVGRAGHSSSEPGIAEAIVSATDQFAARA